MASNFLNNLSNTYRQSPSLQNQFATEQDYLDLFDNNQVTPAMAQAYVPTNDTTGIKSIVNTATPIINQGGDGGDGPPGAPPGDPSFDYETEAYGLNNLTPEEKGITEKEQEDLDDTGLGLKDAFGLAIGGPFGYATGKIGQWAFGKVKDKYSEWAEKEKERKDIELQKEIDAANKEAAQQAAFDRAMADQRGFYASLNDGRGASVSDQSRDQAGDGNQSGPSPFARGGRVKSYFNGGIAGFKNGGRINFRGGGMDMGNASNQAQSASMGSSKSSTNQGPAGGASSGGNYGGNRNPKQTYGGGGGPKPGSGRVNTVNRFGPKNLSFFDKINIHSANNAKLEKAYRDKVIDSDEYNVLGGLSSKRDLGFGPVKTAAASTAYNLVQSALGPKFSRGNQPLFDGASDIGRNTFGSTLDPNSALAQTYDTIMNTYKRGGRVNYFNGGIVSLRRR